MIGDLNTGLHRKDETGATFVCADQFRAFGTLFVDAWRETHGDVAREASWYSHVGNGFRIDHAFVSPALAPLIKGCRYDHAPRKARTTDHAMHPHCPEHHPDRGGARRTPGKGSGSSSSAFREVVLSRAGGPCKANVDGVRYIAVDGLEAHHEVPLAMGALGLLGATRRGAASRRKEKPCIGYSCCIEARGASHSQPRSG